ncbi:hypothetical protein B7463_g9456, partial [Scytalidium lignicola]
MSAVYALGSNGSGQLGVGHKEDISVPKPICFQEPLTERIASVRAGGNHSLLLSSNGKLYWSGDPSSGACGLSHNTEIPQFQLLCPFAEEVDITGRIIHFAATWEASIIVFREESSQLSRVYSFGMGNKGELGLGELLFRTSKAELIKDFPPVGLEIVDLAASISHVIAVLSNGDVYGWGNGRKGQLGDAHDIVYFPRKISGINFKVSRAVCGREFTYLLSHPEDGHHLIIGSDKWGIKGLAPPDVKHWKEVGAGWGSIVVLLKNGKLLSWGRDDHGELAPPNLPPVSCVAVGSEHVLVLTTEGDVLTWGWGEHGNCGPNTIQGDVKGRSNMIASSKYLPPGSHIFGIGAGCATSWIFISG